MMVAMNAGQLAQSHMQTQSAPPHPSANSTTSTTSSSAFTDPQVVADTAPCQLLLRKRKANGQDNNERLSKRLSLLNLERNGARLYDPVESPTSSRDQTGGSQPLSSSSSPSIPLSTSTSYSSPGSSSGPGLFPSGRHSSRPGQDRNGDDDMMHLDDSRHKVYIYNLDEELSSETAEPDETPGRLIFLSDIDRHLRRAAAPGGASPPIPRPVPPSADGELAGMQLVLYNVPTSLSVPEERDGVRRAIIEARARIRERQTGDASRAHTSAGLVPGQPPAVLGVAPAAVGLDGPWVQEPDDYDDPDAMDLS